MQLNSKFLLFVIPLIVVPIASVGWLAYDRLSSISEQAMLRQVNTLVSQTEQQVQTYFRTLRANLGLFADSRMLKNYILASEEDRFELLQRPLLRQLKAYNRAFPEYYEIRIILEDGYEDARFTGEQLENITDEESENPAFLAMHDYRDDTFIKLFMNPDTSSWALWASQRLMLIDASAVGNDAQEPSLRGYLVLTVGLDLLQEQTSNQVGKKGLLFFTNNSGQILFHADTSRIGSSIPAEVIRPAATQDHFNVTSDDHLFTGQRLNEDLLLFTQLPVTEIQEAGKRLGWLILGITLAAIFITVTLLLLLLNRLLIGPIHQLADAAQRIGEGELDQQLEIHRNDEIGALASSFNGMSQELKHSQDQKERAQAEALKNRELAIANLERADKLKDEILANTSHELRTPLNGIIGLAESLIDGVAGPMNKEARKNLIMIMSSGQRLANLVNDILDFSKLKHNNLELQLTSVNIKPMCEGIFALSISTLSNKPIVAINSIGDDLPAALADENRLQQVLYNLVGNAFKFTREGEVEIFARVEPCDNPPEPKNAENIDKSRRLVIGVRDTGVGIPESAQATIFESFEQGDGSTAREFGGTGLGLAVSKQLVELHGGEIWFETTAGEGSTFFFSLPISTSKSVASKTMYFSLVEEDADEDEIIDLTQTALVYANQGKDFEILIVDDEPINLQVLENHLSHLNYHVERADNGMEALAKIKAGYTPDLILLDIMMPSISGFEVCKKLRETLPASALPILMLTAKNQPQDIIEGFNVGANDYLTKPVTKGELLARVKTHISLQNINVALNRFVPHEFLRLLNKESILDVKLGDQVAREMTVLFSDIRDFTSLSERMTPRETYDFINKYLSCMEPIITRHHGFIDKYIGDAIMALYPSEAEEAVTGAIEMLQELKRFNSKREALNQAPIRIGVGLNTGQLMLGTVGGSNRMDGTVISDTVNLASRIEGLTKLYGVPLLISEHTLAKLPNDHGHLIRELDTVKVRGKEIAVTVYEVFDADPEELVQQKKATLSLFEKAVHHFRDGELNPAITLFLQVLEESPDDMAASIYATRCTDHCSNKDDLER